MKGTLTLNIAWILRISKVWSEFSLAAWRNLASLAIQNAISEDSEQHAQKRRQIWIFAGRTSMKVRFLTLRLIILMNVEREFQYMLMPLDKSKQCRPR